jgi:hypothetical protein
MKNNFLQNKRASALLMTVMILSSILIVVLGVSSLVSSSLRLSRAQENSAKAYYAAESGVERLIWAIGKDSFDLGSCDLSVNKFVDFVGKKCTSAKNIYSLSNNSSYYLTYTNDSPSSFEVVGKYANISRSIEISY